MPTNAPIGLVARRRLYGILIFAFHGLVAIYLAVDSPMTMYANQPQTSGMHLRDAMPGVRSNEQHQRAIRDGIGMTALGRLAPTRLSRADVSGHGTLSANNPMPIGYRIAAVPISITVPTHDEGDNSVVTLTLADISAIQATAYSALQPSLMSGDDGPKGTLFMDLQLVGGLARSEGSRPEATPNERAVCFAVYRTVVAIGRWDHMLFVPADEGLKGSRRARCHGNYVDAFKNWAVEGLKFEANQAIGDKDGDGIADEEEKDEGEVALPPIFLAAPPNVPQHQAIHFLATNRQPTLTPISPFAALVHGEKDSMEIMQKMAQEEIKVGNPHQVPWLDQLLLGKIAHCQALLGGKEHLARIMNRVASYSMTTASLVSLMAGSLDRYDSAKALGISTKLPEVFKSMLDGAEGTSVFGEDIAVLQSPINEQIISALDKAIDPRMGLPTLVLATGCSKQTWPEPRGIYGIYWACLDVEGTMQLDVYPSHRIVM